MAIEFAGKIEAIKAVRQMAYDAVKTACVMPNDDGVLVIKVYAPGLKDSKDLVEAVMRLGARTLVEFEGGRLVPMDETELAIVIAALRGFKYAQAADIERLDTIDGRGNPELGHAVEFRDRADVLQGKFEAELRKIR